jgi:hypothetical protein
MKRGIGTLLIVGGLLGAFALGRAGAQEGMDEMAAWMELAKVGPEHAELKQAVGTWSCDSKYWMTPEAPPTESKATAVFSMELGGRFQKLVYKCDSPQMPFEGIGFTGFNNATRKYETIWMDSMGTAIMMMTGTRTADGVWEYAGSFFGPGGKEIKCRSVLKKVSDDQTTMEMYCDEGNGEHKMMEQTYTRAK